MNTLSSYVQVCKHRLPRPANKPVVLQPSLPWTRGGLLFKESSSVGDCGVSGVGVADKNKHSTNEWREKPQIIEEQQSSRS